MVYGIKAEGRAAVGRKRDSQATQTPVGHSSSTRIMFDNGWRRACSKEAGLPDGVNETPDAQTVKFQG